MPDPRGRQPIGFNQPNGGGTNYPFIKPSPDIEFLLGDVFLSFDDELDAVAYPLKVSWLYGFGTNVVSAPVGYPTPSNSFDIIITDDNDVVVFDSTEAALKHDPPYLWDNRLYVLEWVASTGRSVLRVTTHAAWTQEDLDAGLDKTYDNYIVPASGELQQDTWYKIPRRVTRLIVQTKSGPSIISSGNVHLQPGYNFEVNQGSEFQLDAIDIPDFFDTPEPTLEAGERISESFTLAAVPGSGLGVKSGCDEEELFIRTVNGIRSNDFQNFNWDSEGCLRYQRPVGLQTTAPRVFSYAAASLLADDNVGGLDGYELASQSAIELLNDCTNCCDCNYFAQTYQGIKRQWFLYKDLADASVTTRDILSANIDRWTVQKEIRARDAIISQMRADGLGKLTWGATYCNSTQSCVVNGKFIVVFIYYNDGTMEIPDQDPYDCGITELEGTLQCNGPVPVTPIIDPAYNYMVLEVPFEYADPQTLTTVIGRVCFPTAAGTSTKSRAYILVTAEALLTDGEPESPTYLTASDVPSELVSGLSLVGYTFPSNLLYQASTPLITVESSNPNCDQCECIEPEVDDRFTGGGGEAIP